MAATLMNLPLIRFVAAALLVASCGAFAERADREKEIVVGADRVLIDDASKLWTFEGAVVITQGTMRMTANKVTAKEDAERHNVYVATGAPATFRQKRDKVDEWVEGSADRAEYEDRNEVLRLFNGARVRMSRNEITGGFISYDVKREVAEALGAPPGTAAPPNSRAKVRITPKTSDAKAGEKPAAEAPLQLKPDAGRS